MAWPGVGDRHLLYISSMGIGSLSASLTATLLAMASLHFNGFQRSSYDSLVNWVNFRTSVILCP